MGFWWHFEVQEQTPQPRPKQDCCSYCRHATTILLPDYYYCYYYYHHYYDDDDYYFYHYFGSVLRSIQ